MNLGLAPRTLREKESKQKKYYGVSIEVLGKLSWSPVRTFMFALTLQNLL